MLTEDKIFFTNSDYLEEIPIFFKLNYSLKLQGWLTVSYLPAVEFGELSGKAPEFAVRTVTGVGIRTVR